MRRSPVASDRRLRRVVAIMDHGPQERWQHSTRALEPTEAAGILAARVLEETMLDILLLRGMIDAVARDAGLRLRGDFHAAGMLERVIGSYNPARTSFSPFSSAMDRSDAEEAAYRRWRQALGVLQKNCAEVVNDTACYDAAPDLRQLRLLKAGLADLARYYRL